VSVRVSMHTPPQSVSLAGHVHVPALHVVPGEHDTPHAPQLRRSETRFAQAAAQLTSGAGQLTVHDAPEQT
jgi:L-alanine-DL-glutamate epimerase-like enolase superfamily enzyme